MGDNLRFFASLAPEAGRSHSKDQTGNNPEFDRLANLSPGSPDFHGFEYNSLDWAEYEMRQNQGDPTIPKRKRRAEKTQNQTSVPYPVSTEKPRVQAKLEIGRADDPLEREADEIADRVMRSPTPSMNVADRPAVFRTDWRPKGHVMPKRYGNTGDTERPDHLFDALHRSRGNKLSESERTFFEPRFGRSFEEVRVHTGPEAATAAESIQAKAFATGNDVFFGEGEYQPNTDEGKRLVAHELAHVVQQSESRRAVIQRQPSNKFSVEMPPLQEANGQIRLKQGGTLDEVIRQYYGQALSRNPDSAYDSILKWIQQENGFENTPNWTKRITPEMTVTLPAYSKIDEFIPIQPVQKDGMRSPSPEEEALVQDIRIWLAVSIADSVQITSAILNIVTVYYTKENALRVLWQVNDIARVLAKDKVLSPLRTAFAQNISAIIMAGLSSTKHLDELKRGLSLNSFVLGKYPSYGTIIFGTIEALKAVGPWVGFLDAVIGLARLNISIHKGDEMARAAGTDLAMARAYFRAICEFMDTVIEGKPTSDPELKARILSDIYTKALAERDKLQDYHVGPIFEKHMGQLGRNGQLHKLAAQYTVAAIPYLQRAKENWAQAIEAYKGASSSAASIIGNIALLPRTLRPELVTLGIFMTIASQDIYNIGDRNLAMRIGDATMNTLDLMLSGDDSIREFIRDAAYNRIGSVVGVLGGPEIE